MCTAPACSLPDVSLRRLLNQTQRCLPWGPHSWCRAAPAGGRVARHRWPRIQGHTASGAPPPRVCPQATRDHVSKGYDPEDRAGKDGSAREGRSFVRPRDPGLRWVFCLIAFEQPREVCVASLVHSRRNKLRGSHDLSVATQYPTSASAWCPTCLWGVTQPAYLPCSMALPVSWGPFQDEQGGLAWLLGQLPARHTPHPHGGTRTRRHP